MSLYKKVVMGIIIILCAVIYEDSFLPSRIQVSSHKITNDLHSDAGINNLPPRAEYEYLRLRNPETGKIPGGITRRQLNFAKTIPTIEAIRMNKPAKGEKAMSYGWKNRGPENVGGRTRALGLDIRDENIMIAGGVSGGMWKSTDNGDTWIKKTRPEQLHNITCLVQDTRPGREDTWFSGTGEFYPGILSGDGIYKSIDNGDSWEMLPSTSTENPEHIDNPFDFIWALAIDISNTEEDEIYAAAFGSIQRSVDGGDTWECVLGGSGSAWSYTDVKISPAGVVYAALSFGSMEGIWRSEDGVNWTNITPPDWPDFFRRVMMGIATSNENVVYFYADITEEFIDYDYSEQCFWKYTYVSGDGSNEGGLWEDRSTYMPRNIDHNMSYCMSLKVHPDDENMVFMGGVELWRSTNGYSGNKDAISNRLNNTSGIHVDQHDLIFSVNDPNTAYAIHDGGISKTDDILAVDVQWEYKNNQFVTTQFYTAALVPDVPGDQRIMGGTQDNGTFYTEYADPSDDWLMAEFGDGAYCAFLDGGTRYLVSRNDGLVFLRDQISYNSGLYENPLPRTMINPQYTSTPLFINPFAVDPNENDVIYLAGGTELWRNSDISAIPMDGSLSYKATNWSIIAETDNQISALGLSDSPANVLYIGTVTGEIYVLNNGKSPTPYISDRYTGKGLPHGYISCIAVDPHDADNAVVTFSNYETKSIYATWNRGRNWSQVSGNLEENSDGSGSGPSVKWITILRENGSNTYFAGTSTGLYSTAELDGMDTEWSQEGSNTIGNVIVEMVISRETDGEVVVATHGNGIYSRDFTTGIEENDRRVTPDGFELMQNYPNPFNPSTTISFKLLSPSDVSLKIYNISGQLVKTLISKKMSSGQHVIKWNGKNDLGMKVGSGLYIYSLKAGTFSSTRKMVILK
ncbi:T9SS type A sorting domain-containing protein [candidate division KSB1 bacterium]